MLKYVGYYVVFREIPDEISLAINITNCPYRCENCHTPKLQEDTGELLTLEELGGIIKENPGITCVLFMGGDSDIEALNVLAQHVKVHYKLKVGVYSGSMFKHIVPRLEMKYFDYVKTGPYVERFGGLDKETTNQRLYKVKHTMGLNRLINITERFWDEAKGLRTE